MKATPIAHGLVCLLLFIGPLSLLAQYATTPTGARGAAMGDCGVALNDLHAATINIAASSALQGGHIALSYRQDYLLSQLSHKTLTASYGFGPRGTLLAHYTHYGSTTYNEQHVLLGYAISLSSLFSVGIGADYLHSGTSMAGYADNRVTCSMGLQYRPTHKLTIGASVFNPLFVRSGSSAEISSRIPVDLRIGVAYQLLRPLLATLEVEKNIYETATLHGGLEYNYHSWLFARAGFSTAPMHLTLGAGIQLPHYALDLSLRYHNVLGLTPQLSLQYNF